MEVARSPVGVLGRGSLHVAKYGLPIAKTHHSQVGGASGQSLLFPLSGGHVNYSHEDPGIGSHNDPQGQQQHDHAASIDEVLKEGCVCTRETQHMGPHRRSGLPGESHSRGS